MFGRIIALGSLLAIRLAHLPDTLPHDIDIAFERHESQAEPERNDDGSKENVHAPLAQL